MQAHQRAAEPGTTTTLAGRAQASAPVWLRWLLPPFFPELILPVAFQDLPSSVYDNFITKLD